MRQSVGFIISLLTVMGESPAEPSAEVTRAKFSVT